MIQKGDLKKDLPGTYLKRRDAHDINLRQIFFTSLLGTGGFFSQILQALRNSFPKWLSLCSSTLIECVTRTTMNRECGPLQIRWIALSVCLASKSRNYRFYIRIARLPLWAVRYLHWIGHIKQLFQDLHRGCPILQSEGLTKGNHNCFGPRMRFLCAKGSIMSKI